MFCVLRIVKRENKLFERLFGSFIKDDYSLDSVPVFKGAPFFVVTVAVGRNGVDWEKVAAISGKCSAKLLCAEAIPETDCIGRFESSLLKNRIAENTFIKLLEQNNLKNHPADIAVTDSKALNTAFTEKIAPFAASLTVVTDNKERYGKTAERLLQETGTSAALLSSVNGEKIIIDSDNYIMTVQTDNGKMKIQNGCDFTVPESYRALLPEGIDKYDFYSALYELCGVFSLGECIFSSIEVNNEKKNTDSIHFS